MTTDPYGLSRRRSFKNPLPKDHVLYDKLENTVKYYTHESQVGKRLQWELLGFVMPSNRAKGGPERYVKLSTIVDSLDARGMLALKGAK